MAIDASKGFVFINCNQFLTEILSQTFFVVTLSAGRNRHIRLQPAESRRFGDIDVARGAFSNMDFLLPTALVHELQRNS